ncbi:type VI secretion system-associated protein TagF [Rhodocaloribacter litoris]|uniref:type VI secretion system-associated protein TagF n=1 Tax=Rhodocaloribacter litoris TaxID=2558931 RepID=UPI001422911B|nr:type VI secretion system-associated protein TagF [Rhodocaloribacter litoris]QXD13868.1 type VI secretion system-associated protein TagF [Rhodocaloribacter litoris]GIV60304.1 MAG: hypothetical protein KatS3mg043_1393 [Rhodothermaceae bacterium]
MQTLPTTIAYFGKLPTHGDFVQRNAGGAALRALDAWLQKGLYVARRQLGARFEATYDAMPPFAFRYHTGDGLLVGVIHPSRDRVGRRYPFMVAFEVPEAEAGPAPVPETPLRYAAFFERAAQLARRAAGGDLEPALLAPAAERFGDLVDGRDARPALERFYRETPLPTLWEHLWGHADDSRKYILFKNLLDILLPLQRTVPTGFPLVLRFPLCADAGRRPFVVSFWTDVCLRLVDGPAAGSSACPSLFWTHPVSQETPNAPHLLLTLRPPRAGSFALLVNPALDDDTLCDLESLGSRNAAQAALAIPARYGELLEADHLSLATFLDRL